MKDKLSKIENALIYIGYAGGTILLLENMAKIVSTGSTVGSRIMLFAFIFWLFTFLSRTFVFERHNFKMKLAQKIRLELMYFVFSHTFVIMFVSTMLKYTPLFYTQSIEISNYSGIVNYITREFVFFFIVNALSFAFFMWFLLFSSKVIYMATLQNKNFYNGDTKKMSFMQSAVFALMLTLSLCVLNIPVVWISLDNINKASGAFLKGHFAWLVDYVLGSPIVYYAYASIKGSELVERFSLLRKVV